MEPDTDNHQNYTRPGWGVDRKITASVLFVVLFQAAAGIWWAATINGQVSMNSQTSETIKIELNDLEDDFDFLREQNQGVAGRVIRLEEKVDQHTTLLNKILEEIQRRD